MHSMHLKLIKMLVVSSSLDLRRLSLVGRLGSINVGGSFLWRFVAEWNSSSGVSDQQSVGLNSGHDTRVLLKAR